MKATSQNMGNTQQIDDGGLAILKRILLYFIAGIIAGIMLGVSVDFYRFVQAIIIESDSMLILFIKEALVPLGGLYVAVIVGNKALVKLGLPAKAPQQNKIIATISIILGCFIGVFVFVLIKIQLQPLVSASEALNIFIFLFGVLFCLYWLRK